jgi:hypothetical protein
MGGLIPRISASLSNSCGTHNADEEVWRKLCHPQTRAQTRA